MSEFQGYAQFLSDDHPVKQEVQELKAKIAELHKRLYEERLLRETDHDLIKAEGIEEFRDYYSLSNNGTYTDQDIDEWLDKLEASDECN